jgi:hypothetical protein
MVVNYSTVKALPIINETTCARAQILNVDLTRSFSTPVTKLGVLISPPNTVKYNFVSVHIPWIIDSTWKPTKFRYAIITDFSHKRKLFGK